MMMMMDQISSASSGTPFRTGFSTTLPTHARHRNLDGLARGDSCAQEMLIRALANTRIITRSSGIYLGSNRKPIVGKVPLEVFTLLEVARPRAPEKTVDLRE